MPHTAHRLSVKHRARPRQAKLVANAELRSYVQGKLAKKWSPQQISHRLIKDFPTTPQMRASTETIYQTIYVHARGELTRELAKATAPRSNCAQTTQAARCPPAAVRRPDELHQQSAGGG